MDYGIGGVCWCSIPCIISTFNLYVFHLQMLVNQSDDRFVWCWTTGWWLAASNVFGRDCKYWSFWTILSSLYYTLVKFTIPTDSTVTTVYTLTLGRHCLHVALYRQTDKCTVWNSECITVSQLVIFKQVHLYFSGMPWKVLAICMTFIQSETKTLHLLLDN